MDGTFSRGADGASSSGGAEDELRVLVSENEALAELSAQMLLVGAVAEAALRGATADELLDELLERLALTHDLSLAAFGELDSGALRIARAFSTLDCPTPSRLAWPSGEPTTESRVLSSESLALVAGSPLAAALGSEVVAALLPVRRASAEPAVLLLVGPSSSQGFGPALSGLTHVADVLGMELDRLGLLAQLSAAKARLEHAVLERTAQLQASLEELRASERRFRALVECAPDATYQVDADGNFIEVSERDASALGRTRAELLGYSFSLIEADDCRPSLAAELALRQRGGGVGTGTLLRRHRRADGTTFPVSVRLVPLEEATSAVTYVVVARDESDRELLEARLRQAQRLEAIGRVAGGVAHDFNNLLTAILGNAELLRDELVPDGEGKVLLEELVTAGEQAGQLTRQLLAFARQQRLTLGTVRLAELVREAVPVLSRVLGPRWPLRLDLDETASAVRADATQLTQVLLNLCMNARDAMPGGGPIDIALAASLPCGRCGGAGLGRCASLTVSDRGVGIAPDVLPHIFEPFFTTKGVGHGTGLGLATVYGVAQQHGGVVTVTSEPGQGASFRVCLPLLETETPVGHAAEAERAPAEGAPLTVLVVDDCTSVRRVLEVGLRRLGFIVLGADGGAEALALLAERRGHVDVVLSDVVMPGMDGRELVERIEALYPSVGTVLLSGYSGEDEPTSPRRSSQPVLMKPARAEVVAEALRRAVRAHAPPES